MKKLIFTIATIVIASSTFAQKYWVESFVNPSLDKSKDYKVAILPIISDDTELNGDDKLLKLAYDKISLQLSGIKHFEPVSKQKVEKAARIFSFGGSNEVKEENYKEIASQSGANIILLCDLTKETIVKKGVQVIRINIKMFDVNKDNSIVYNAKARSKNPLSKDAEVEYGIENAFKKLKKEME